MATTSQNPAKVEKKIDKLDEKRKKATMAGNTKKAGKLLDKRASLQSSRGADYMKKGGTKKCAKGGTKKAEVGGVMGDPLEKCKGGKCKVKTPPMKKLGKSRGASAGAFSKKKANWL